MPTQPDPNLIALGIRQPWAELIARGVKTIEVRTIGTAIRGRIYLYASRTLSDHPAAVIAAQAHGLTLSDLPRGVIVGTAEISATGPLSEEDAAATCLRPIDLRKPGLIGWSLTAAERFDEPLPVRFLPYGIWFYPFRRRSNPSNRSARST